MSDFTIRADAVDVEQIMQQIRRRIAEKRGVDYTEAQIRDIASVRLEKFQDPRNVRSDLLEHFRHSRPTAEAECATFAGACSFDDQTLFTSHRAPMRFVRRLLMPILKLFFNPNTLNHVLHTQSHLNVALLTRSAKWNALQYEVMHNLVLETTRMSIEVKNLKMLVESLSSRLDFSERRARALEGVVAYRPDAVAARDPRLALPASGTDASGPAQAADAADQPPSPGAAGAAAPALPPASARRRRGRRGR